MRFVKRASSILSSFLPCILVGAAGIGMSLTAALLSESHESEHAELQFQVLAENHFMVIQNGLNEYVNRLRAMRALFDSTEDRVTRREFETFARPLLLENSAIVTLSWVPRVLQSERAEHERAGSAEGIAGYRIKAMEEDGRLVLSSAQSEYYPIFYATVPLDSPVYGLDLRSEPETLAELEHARDADRLGFSQVRGLVTTGGKQPGFLFSLPVYKHGIPHDSVADRRRNLLGFVHGSLITGKMINDIITANKTPKGLDSYFFEPNSVPDALPVYIHGSRLRKTPAEPLDHISLTSGWSRDLRADGQPWLTMTVMRMPGGPLLATHERSWLILVFGLIITGAVVIYIRSSRRHASRMMRVNKKVFALAQLDALTSLANRRTFSQRLSEAFASSRRDAKPFAVLYFDLDHFKDVNDTLGHPVGDALLQQVAIRVAGAIRKNDLVARFGGDEFAVLQTDVGDPAEAGLLASKIGDLIAKPYVIEGNEVHISASIGISRYTAEVAGPDALQYDGDKNVIYLPLAREQCRVSLTYKGAKIVAIEPGLAFDREEWDRICAEIEGPIMKGPLKVGRDISFNTKGVEGWWRGERSGVQILAAPESAPRANEGADNPFILEFPILDAGVWPTTNYSITNQRRRREHQKLTLLLNLLLGGTTKFLRERPRHFWANVRSSAELKIEWAQEWYFADFGQIVIQELSAPVGEKLGQIELEKYSQ